MKFSTNQSQACILASVNRKNTFRISNLLLFLDALTFQLECAAKKNMAENTDVRSAGLHSVRCFERNLGVLSRVQLQSLDFTCLLLLKAHFKLFMTAQLHQLFMIIINKITGSHAISNDCLNNCMVVACLSINSQCVLTLPPLHHILHRIACSTEVSPVDLAISRWTCAS